MGGIPGAVGNAASAVGSHIGDAAKSFWGAAKDGVQQNYVQPWRNAVSDMRGNPQADPAAGPGGATTGDGSAMQTFFNAPATETPAMRLRRAYAQQA